MIHERILNAYEAGRSTSISNKEMLGLAKRYVPELFPSEFERIRALARKLSIQVITHLVGSLEVRGQGNHLYPCLEGFLKEYPVIQYINLTDREGKLLASVVNDRQYQDEYDSRMPLGYDCSSREWFVEPMKKGSLHVTDIYQSLFTRRLVVSVSAPVVDADDNITGIIGLDIKLEELLRAAEALEENNGNPE
jgi:hypothetical protein